MAKQITKTVYTFAELLDLHKQAKTTEKAVENARQWLREAQTEGEWYECTADTWKSALEQIGFENADIRFRGFWSQGDGASFTTKTVDVAKLAAFLSADIKPSERIEPTAETGDDEDFRPWIVHKLGDKSSGKLKIARVAKLVNSITASINRTDSHYVHWNTCRFELELDDRGRHFPHVNLIVDEFEQAAEDLRERLSRAIYRDLETDYEYLTSDEALLEFADGNDYTFTIGGAFER